MEIMTSYWPVAIWRTKRHNAVPLADQSATTTHSSRIGILASIVRITFTLTFTPTKEQTTSQKQHLQINKTRTKAFCLQLNAVFERMNHSFEHVGNNYRKNPRQSVWSTTISHVCLSEFRTWIGRLHAFLLMLCHEATLPVDLQFSLHITPIGLLTMVLLLTTLIGFSKLMSKRVTIYKTNRNNNMRTERTRAFYFATQTSKKRWNPFLINQIFSDFITENLPILVVILFKGFIYF